MRLCPSPNFGPRRDGLRPSIVVLHYTAMQSAQAALTRLCDPEAEVSAHYLISAQGEIIRMVDEEQRAWHAGVGEWRGQSDINSRSIGIELDNAGDHPFSEPLMVALEELLPGILARWDIAADDVIGHSDMAPGRKWDPGARFDWARLARSGLAGPTRIPSADGSFVDRARAAGFSADVPDDVLLAATRLRFAPWREGACGPEDNGLYHHL